MSTCKCVCELLPSLISLVCGSGINYGKALMSTIVPPQRMMRQLRSSVSQHLFCIVRTNLIFRSPTHYISTREQWVKFFSVILADFLQYIITYPDEGGLKTPVCQKYLRGTCKLCISTCPIKQSGDSQQKAKIVRANLKCPKKKCTHSG